MAHDDIWVRPVFDPSKPIDVEAVEREARRLRAEAIQGMAKALWARVRRLGHKAVRAS